LEKETVKRGRAVEASKQCGRTISTCIDNTLNFHEATKEYAKSELAIILHVTCEDTVKIILRTLYK